MNTEDRLRRASREIEQATVSLTPPPLKDVRRSARMRGLGVALASAAAVVVLVGGALLLVSGSGQSTIDPAAPGETTSTTEATQATWDLDGAPIVIPPLDSAPEFSIGESAQEIPIGGIDSQVVDRLRVDVGISGDFLSSTDEIIYLGSQGDLVAFAVMGDLGPDAPDYLGSGKGECIGIVRAGGGGGGGCDAIGRRGELDPYISFVDGDRDHTAFAVAGRAAEGASVVVLEVDETRYWQRTRDGYVFLSVEAPATSTVRYIVYDVAGNVLGGTTINTETSLETSGCSGNVAAPLTFDGIPEDVLATVLAIIDAAQACDFDRLEAIAGDAFTASYGGGDPADLWRAQESQGDKPMRWLVSMFGLGHGVIETENGDLYVWPSAYAHQGSWETTPEADVEALRSLYSEGDLQDFADFGGYFGYRIGIWENGDWSFFVAGD